jgi:two-component system, cell cycle sensor histidine kinase and response regulator CckA
MLPFLIPAGWGASKFLLHPARLRGIPNAVPKLAPRSESNHVPDSTERPPGALPQARTVARTDRRLLQVARKVTATLGTDFFQAMVKHLSAALSADCLIIGEFVGGKEERCRTLAAWLDHDPAGFNFPLAGSATAGVALGNVVRCRSNGQERFPSDDLLQSVRAQAYIAVPLTDNNRRPIGVLMSLFRRPIVSMRFSQELLEIFATRASAELTRKQEEDRLRESEQRYRAFIARNADAMWRIEFEPPIPTDLPEQEQLERIYQTGYIAECNEALAHLLGRERAEQLIGCGIDEIAPASDPTVREATLVSIRSGYRLTNFETSPLDAHGNRRHLLRSQWGVVQNGHLERVWGATRDITDCKRAETALEASEQRMADVLEAMHLLVVLLDPDGLIAFCNSYLYHLTGWTPDELLGQNWLAKLIPKEEHARLQSELTLGALNPDAPIHFDSTFVDADGSRRHLACDSTTLWRGPGQIAARAIIGRDITEFKALEHEFRQAQKLAAVGRLAGGVAHDFNNLLTVILGYASGLIDKLKPADPAYIGLLEIRKAAEKGAHLSRSLLTFSRRQVLRPKMININALVEDTEPMLAALMGAGIQILTDLDPDAGFARLDAGYFHQVLLNLAINARDAMPGGGKLTIVTSHIQIASAQPCAPAISPGSYVLLTVADNGIGMSEDVREHLFEPFFTTKEMGKGTGLGLATVYGIVTQSGGHILVDTELGHGTAFRIYLPRVEEGPAPADAAIPRAMPRGTETILLVEDGDAVRTLTATILRELGYTVFEAEGPARAMELIRQKPNIHLLLASVGTQDLPAEDLVDRVKSFCPAIRVLFACGNCDSELPSRFGEPAFGYLQKPFTPLALAVKVRELLDPV